MRAWTAPRRGALAIVLSVAMARKQLYVQFLACAVVAVLIFGCSGRIGDDMSRAFSLGATDRAATVAITEVPKVACLLFTPSPNRVDCVNAVKR